MSIMNEAIQVITIDTGTGKKHILHAKPSDIFGFFERHSDGRLSYLGEQLGSDTSMATIKCEDGDTFRIEGDGTISGVVDVLARCGIFSSFEERKSPQVDLFEDIYSQQEELITLANGNRYWKRGVKLHRDGAPAYEGTDGSLAYYFDGKLHREDGPAIILADGTKEWFINGFRHRMDGPAVQPGGTGNATGQRQGGA